MEKDSLLNQMGVLASDLSQRPKASVPMRRAKDETQQLNPFSYRQASLNFL